MRRLAMVAGVAYSVAVLANCDSSEPTQSGEGASAYAGLWQFPDRQVWIKILPSGETFQCRIATSQVVIRSTGTLSDHQIHWDEIWPVDQVQLEDGELVLSGEFGTFGFIPIDGEMATSCDSPL